MSKRGVKKVKYLKSDNEYQSYDKTCNHPSCLPPSSHESLCQTKMNTEKITPLQHNLKQHGNQHSNDFKFVPNSFSQKVTPPSLILSSNLQNSAGKQLSQANCEGGGAAASGFEYLKVGAQGQTSGLSAFQQSSGQKKYRKKANVSGSKQRLPQQTSQTIDAPTIISNILSTPINQSQFNNYGQASQNTLVGQNALAFSKTAQTTSRKDNASAIVLKQQDSMSEVPSGVNSMHCKLRYTQPAPIFETFKKTGAIQTSASANNKETGDYESISLTIENQRCGVNGDGKQFHHTQPMQPNQFNFEQSSLQQATGEAGWHSPTHFPVNQNGNTAKAQLIQLLESSNAGQVKTHHLKKASGSSAATGSSNIMVNMFMESAQQSQNWINGQHQLAAASAKQPVGNAGPNKQHHHSQQQVPSMSPPRKHQNQAQNFHRGNQMLSAENASVKREFILKTCLSNDIINQRNSGKKDANRQVSVAMYPLYHQLSQSPVSKRQRSAPKLRSNAAAREKQSHQRAGHQHHLHSQPRSKKRPQNSSVSRVSARAKNNQMMQMSAQNSAIVTGAGFHNAASVQLQAQDKREVGRPPALQQHKDVSQSQAPHARHVQQTTQTRAARCRIKNNCQSQQPASHYNITTNITTPFLPLNTGLKHQGRNKATIANSVHQVGANTNSNVRDLSPIKSLAAIAIGLRQNQCQTALLQHKHGSQPAIPPSSIKTPTSKALKEFTRANKTTSTRQHFTRSKRDQIVRQEQHHHSSVNTLTQSNSKINAVPHSQNGNNKSKSNAGQAQQSTKRIELANYLSKILNQQQRMHLNTFDTHQFQALCNENSSSQQGIKIASLNSNATKANSKSGKSMNKGQNDQHPIVLSQHVSGSQPLAASIHQTSKAAKKNGGVVLLSDHQQHVSKYQTKGSSQDHRRSHLSSGSKRGRSNQQRDHSAHQQESEQTTLGNEQRKFKQMFVRFSSQKDNLQQLQQVYQSTKRSQKNVKSGRDCAKSVSNVSNNQTSANINANSMLLTKHQRQLLSLGNKKVNSGKIIQSKNDQIARKGSMGMPGDQNNFLLAQNIQQAIRTRQEALDLLDLAKNQLRLESIVQPSKPQYGKSNSERTLNNNTQKEDLIVTEHTILNIKAHDSSDDEQVNLNAQGNVVEQEDCGDGYAAEQDNMRVKSRSARVEYHSDRDRVSSRFSHQTNKMPNQFQMDLRVVGSKNEEQVNQEFEEELSSKAVEIDVGPLQSDSQGSQTFENLKALQEAVSRCEIGVQTSTLGQSQQASATAQKEATVEVSHREDKNSDSERESNSAELAIWAKEKAAIENYSIFFAEQLEPFMRSLLQQLSQQPTSLSSAAQKLDIFGIRHDQAFSKEDRRNSVTADIIYKLISTMVISLQRLVKVMYESIKHVEQVAEAEILDKDAQHDLQKDQIRKLQKELYIRSEKMHLQEQMHKLKEKEVTTLRNKINALTEAADRTSKEHQKQLQKKDQEQELNFSKAARELKTLYEQNKDLFEHNKALRDDLQDQDEKVRKLVNVIQRHPNVMRDIENELDQTECKIHDQSQISNAIPTSQRPVEPNDSLLNSNKMISPQNRDSANLNPHGVVFVGQNKIAIPKFDPLIIEKYNKLNIEGKLPHIVETNKFDPEAVKQQVKDMFKEIINNGYPEQLSSEQFKTPNVQRVNDQFQSSGIGNHTPISPEQKSLESEIERQRRLILFHESSNSDMSGGGERKQRNIMTKLPSVNSPQYLLENHNFGSEMVQVNSNVLNTQDQLLQSTPMQKMPDSSPFLGSVASVLQQSQLKMTHQTPSQIKQKSKESLLNNAPPKKEHQHSQQMAGGYIEKQHQAQTIVTLQNQLYHQLLSQNTMQQAHGTPNNHQTSSAVNSPNENSHSCQPNLMSPHSQQQLNQQAQSSLSPASSLLQPHIRFGHPSSSQQSNQVLLKHSQQLKAQQHQTQQQQKYCGFEDNRSGPQYQSIDQPLLQTPSQTATLALDFTEGLQQQIVENNSSDVGASTAVFNQILIRGEQENLQRQNQKQMTGQRANAQTTGQQLNSYNQRHYAQSSLGPGAPMTGNRQELPMVSNQSQHIATVSLHHAMQYSEEEKKQLTQNGISQSNTTSHYHETGNHYRGGDNMGDDTSQVTKSNNPSACQPAGGTLQDQISKQYSPILRHQESMENLNDFSPSLINDRNELSSAAEGYKRQMLGLYANNMNSQHMKVIDCSLGDRAAFGLTSIDQEKSVSLLDSIAIKEVDSTQKKYIEPYQSVGGSVDHGGNEQTNSASGQIIIEQHQLKAYPQQPQYQPQFSHNQMRMSQQMQMAEYQPMHAYGEMPHNGQSPDHQSSPRLQNQLQQQRSAQHLSHQQQIQPIQYVEVQFDGGEAPLDISQVNDNFDSRYNDSQSQQDSADFLEDQNFGHDADSGGRRSSDDGFDDGQHLSQEGHQY